MDFIPRKILQSLEKHLKEKEITLILGPRQAGKTTIIKRLKGELEARGEKTAYFSKRFF